MRLGQLQGKRIVSIYFGGGTPTKLTTADYARIFHKLYASNLEFATDCEITLEANPEDVQFSLIREFKQLGINRMSLGVQSLVDDDLIILGRTHTAARAQSAIENVNQAGIENISIDLMYELPHQNLKHWEKTLSNLAHLPVTHLSLYNLTFEAHTSFYKQRATLQAHLPTPEDRLTMLKMAVQHFEACGFKRYEISAFAKAGAQSRHNVGYWTARPFMGFGPSAFSYWEGSRFSNTNHYGRYLSMIEQGSFPVDFTETLEIPRNIHELFAVQLRLVEGIDLALWSKQYGDLPRELQECLDRLMKKGWLDKTEMRMHLTEQGQLFYDSVASEIV